MCAPPVAQGVARLLDPRLYGGTKAYRALRTSGQDSHVVACDHESISSDLPGMGVRAQACSRGLGRAGPLRDARRGMRRSMAWRPAADVVRTPARTAKALRARCAGCGDGRAVMHDRYAADCGVGSAAVVFVSRHFDDDHLPDRERFAKAVPRF